jgi:hypothetical protein
MTERDRLAEIGRLYRQLRGPTMARWSPATVAAIRRLADEQWRQTDPATIGTVPTTILKGPRR